MKKVILVGNKEEVLEKLRIFTDGIDVKLYIVNNIENAIIQIEKEHFDWCIIDAFMQDYDMNVFFEKISGYINKSITIIDVIGYEKTSNFYRNGIEYNANTVTFKVICPIIDMVKNYEYYYCRDADKKIFSGDLYMDIAHKSIIKNGKMIHLSNMEFNLCRILIQSSGLIMPRGLLLENLWDSNLKFIENNTLSVHISRLRKKLGYFEGFQYIETIKGIGYRWNIKSELRNEVEHESIRFID